MDDKRSSWTECQLCDNAEFNPGTVCQIPDNSAPSSAAKLDPEAEKLVQMLTEQILAAVK